MERRWGLPILLPLTGRYPCQLDDNNRLAIPAKVRELLGQNGEAHWYISIGDRAQNLVFWPEEEFVKEAAKLSTGMLASDAALSFKEFYFSHSERARMDKQGRVVIPDVLLTEAQLGKDLMLAGNLNSMTLWPRAVFEEMDRQALADRAKLRVAARQDRELAAAKS